MMTKGRVATCKQALIEIDNSGKKPFHLDL